MTFSIDTWKQQIQAKLGQAKGWLDQAKARQAPYVVYASLSALSLWPVVEVAVKQPGQYGHALAALFTVASSVGAGLLTNQLQHWKEQAQPPTEPEVEQWLADNLANNAELRAALDDLLTKLEVVQQAPYHLSIKDRQWFIDTLHAELTQLDNLSRFEAILIGSGAQALGPHAAAAAASGSGSIAVGKIEGNAYFGTLPPDPTPQHLRQAYLHYLFQQCRTLSLAGVDPKAASDEQAARLSLGQVYTAVLTLSPEQYQRPGRDEFLTWGDKRLSALAMLNRHPRLVLLGDPGSGKSTFINFVALCLAGANLSGAEFNLETLTAPLPNDDGQDEDERQLWVHGPVLPLRVILRDFAARGLPQTSQRASARHLWDFVVADLEASSLGKFADVLQDTLHHPQQGGLILLDGLDEVPEACHRREQIKQAVEDFAAAYPHCRILVTSRPYAYQKQEFQLNGFDAVVLAPFSGGQIRRFVDRWYGHMTLLRGLEQADARGKAEHLKGVILSNERLEKLAERPLLLTLMASLHAWRGGSLPEKRLDLYAEAVELLLDTWETHKFRHDIQGQVVAREPSLTEWLRVDREAIYGLLNRLAFEAHAAQPEAVGTADIPQSDLIDGLLALSRNELVKSALLIDYLRDRAGLLVPHGAGVYSFPHRTFQEYLAARHVVNETFPDPVADLARDDPNRWREVLLLAAAIAGRPSIWSLTEYLCPYNLPPDSPSVSNADVWGAHLAAQALIEVTDVQRVHPIHQPKLERVKQWLVYVLRQAALPAVERALAGHNLALLGDERPGVGLRKDGLPDILWCDVPNGPFKMGSEDDSLKLVGSETPQQRVDLLAFKISRYPITNAQYREFVDARGYHEARYWSVAAAVGYWQEGRVQRRVYAGGKFEDDWGDGPYNYGHPFNLPNYPVVGVTWFEAVAYCGWLTETLQAAGDLKLGQEISLPTESQWEKAARGTDGRLYPWGNEANPEYANCGETNIGTTSTVGCFPTGASSYGVEDMSGNMWEWCRTKFEESFKDYQNDNLLEGGSRRVLRGGAFYNSYQNIRCASRFNNNPFSFNGYFGFRVVLVPST